MYSYKFSEWKSKHVITRKVLLFVSHPTELYIDLFQKVDIKRKSLHKLQLAISRIIPMDLQNITNENGK
jgi:hypothetical protein